MARVVIGSIDMDRKARFVGGMAGRRRRLGSGLKLSTKPRSFPSILTTATLALFILAFCKYFATAYIAAVVQ